MYHELYAIIKKFQSDKCFILQINHKCIFLIYESNNWITKIIVECGFSALPHQPPFWNWKLQVWGHVYARLVSAQFALAVVFALAWFPWDCGRSQCARVGPCIYIYFFISIETVLPSRCSICREVCELTFMLRTAGAAVWAIAGTTVHPFETPTSHIVCLFAHCVFQFDDCYDRLVRGNRRNIKTRYQEAFVCLFVF